MRYWPLSEIAQNPMLPPILRAELYAVYRTGHFSEGAFAACGDIAMHTAPQDTCLTVIDSLYTPPRRVYIGYPDHDEWLRLERGGVVLRQDNTLCVLIDALH